MKICHYRCFNADQRISMENYADALQASLSKSKFEVEPFSPRSRLETYPKSRLIMRYLRYLHYPRLITNCHADIHHVLDQGYAHLLPKLNPGKTCVTVHDLIPMLAWKGVLGAQGKTKQQKPRLNFYSLSFLSKFDHIIAVSQSTAK